MNTPILPAGPETAISAQTNARTTREVLVAIGSVAVVVGAALILWETIVRAREIPPYLLPAPSVIARDLWEGGARYAAASLVTLLEALSGLILGVLVGTLVATLITFWRSLERGVLILAILIKATPIVALIPLLIIWFGFGPVPKIIATGLMTFFPVLINVHAGLHAVDSAVLALFHSLDAGKVVAPLSLVGAVVAEWAGASSGLGRAMWLAYTNLDMPALFAAVVCSALMGISLYGIVVALEKRIIFWK